MQYNEKISMFGKGFVLGWVYHGNPERYVIHPKGLTLSTTSKILYGISTVDNYNVKTNPLLDIEVNLKLFMEHLESAREKFGSDFEITILSTWFVYGKAEKIPVRESDYCNPTGFYSITARAREQLLVSYCETFGIKWRILRLANVLGVGDKKISRKKNAVQFMLQEMVQGREIELYMGSYFRDFIDVRDVAHAIEMVMEKGNLNEIYNIGNGVPYNVSDLIGYVYAKCGGRVKMIAAPEFHKQVQTDTMCLDITKLQCLGYEPQHRLSETLDWLIDYYSHE